MPVLVRVEDYPEVAAWVLQRERLRESLDSTTPSVREVTPAVALEPLRLETEAFAERMVSAAQAAEGEFLPWSVELYAQLARSTGWATADRWKQVMDLTAADPGRFFSTTDVAQQTGMSISDWRSACRTLSRHLKAHYPAGTRWPLHAESGKALGVYDQLYVLATKETARRWLAARAEADDHDLD